MSKRNWNDINCDLVDEEGFEKIEDIHKILSKEQIIDRYEAEKSQVKKSDLPKAMKNSILRDLKSQYKSDLNKKEQL